MSYLNDVFYNDPVENRLFKLTNDAVATGFPVLTGTSPSSILVATNQIDIYVANTDDNSVSIYNNSGVLQKTVTVGTKPVCMCEDAHGNIYVTNYSSRTVSKIVNKTVERNIYVGNGPRGICCSPDGDIYVAMYLANTVVKISNDIVVKTIGVGRMPNGIRADRKNNVYVACTFSNTLVMITNDNKTKDITVGKLPLDVTVDKNGSAWVCNSASNNVMKITNGTVVSTIAVGNKPETITTNKDGEIYVFNAGAHSITKISSTASVGDITTCASPIGFGDPTGYVGYYMHKFISGSSGGSGLTIVGYDDLTDDLKAKINASDITLPISDADVTHAHSTYNTVKKALDYLLYEAPVITSFTNDVNNVELGSVITDVTLNYTTNKDMASLKINNGVGDVTGTTSKKISDLVMKSDTTYTLTATDAESTVVTKTTSIRFLNSVYYGAATTPVTTTTDVLALDSNKLASGKGMTATFNCTGGKYIYFAMPTSFGLTVNDFKIGGLANSAWDVSTISVTNAHSHTESYSVFKSQNLQNGAAITVAIA